MEVGGCLGLGLAIVAFEFDIDVKMWFLCSWAMKLFGLEGRDFCGFLGLGCCSFRMGFLLFNRMLNMCILVLQPLGMETVGCWWISGLGVGFCRYGI